MTGEENLMVDYERARDFFNLDECEKERDLLILQSAQESVENYLDRKLCIAEYICIQRIQDRRIILEELNPVELVRILDLTARQSLNADCHLDGRKLYFFDGRLENHEILARYTAGFTKETLPQDLAECIMNVFMHKSECARKRSVRVR